MRYALSIITAAIVALVVGCAYEEPCGEVYIEVVNFSPDVIFVHTNDGGPNDDTSDRCFSYYYGSQCPHIFYPGERREYKCKPHENTLVFVWAKDYYPLDTLENVPNSGLSMDEFDTRKRKRVRGISIYKSEGNEAEQCRFQLTIKPEEGFDKRLGLAGGNPMKYRMQLESI